LKDSLSLRQRFLLEWFRRFRKNETILHPLQYLFWECTLQSSSVPQPNFSYARVQWFDGITSSAEVLISGIVYGTDDYDNETLEVTYDGAQGNVNKWKIYSCQHAYMRGRVTIDYDYEDFFHVWHHIHYWYDFSKTTQEEFDYQIPVCIGLYNIPADPVPYEGGGE